MVRDAQRDPDLLLASPERNAYPHPRQKLDLVKLLTDGIIVMLA